MSIHYTHRRCKNLFMCLRAYSRLLGMLGSGEFGTVCKGQWTYSEKVLDVAIKVLTDANDETSKVKFLQEAAIMSQFRHPNVIKLYGVANNGNQVADPTWQFYAHVQYMINISDYAGS